MGLYIIYFENQDGIYVEAQTEENVARAIDEGMFGLYKGVFGIQHIEERYKDVIMTKAKEVYKIV